MRRLGLPLPPVAKARENLAAAAPSQNMGEIASAFIVLIVVATEQACAALADSAGVPWCVPDPQRARFASRARFALSASLPSAPRLSFTARNAAARFSRAFVLSSRAGARWTGREGVTRGWRGDVSASETAILLVALLCGRVLFWRLEGIAAEWVWRRADPDYETSDRSECERRSSRACSSTATLATPSTAAWPS